VRARTAALLASACVSAVTAETALADNAGFSPVEPHSPNAQRITDAYWLVFGLTAVIFVLVETTLILFVIRYRRRGRPRTAEGPQIHGSSRLETIWTAFPVVVLALVAAFIFYKLPGIKNVPPARAGGGELVQIRAQQFYWQFTYPGGQTSINRLVAPVNEVVRLDITSPDVAHSWWVPALGGKIDAIPGKTNHMWFQADQVGVYHGQCAEFCGLQHTEMKAAVEAVSPAEYRAFLASHSQGSVAVAKETVAGVCAPCHGLAGQGNVGPKLQGNGRLADAAGMRLLLRKGQKAMPAVGANWSRQQLDATIRYLQATYGAKGGQT
jgi:cytochrome c oxidase subunit 2